MSGEMGFTIHIHPELRRLRSGEGMGGHPDQAAAVPEPEQAVEPEPGTGLVPEQAGVAVEPAVRYPQGALVRLRRDGRRPLCFEGVRLLSIPLVSVDAEDLPDTTPGELALWLASDGRIAGQLRRPAPVPCGEADRRIFRADWLSAPADLSALMRA